MRFFLKNIVVWISSLVLFLIIPILIISEYDNYDKSVSVNNNIISLQTKSQFDDLDVLFVGSSYCYSSINPKILDSANIKSYNLGIATAGVEFTELIINDYLNNIKNYPPKIFITISPMIFSNVSDNYESYPIHRYLENPFSNIEIASKYQHWQNLSKMYKKSFKKGLRNLKSSLLPANIIVDEQTGRISKQIIYKGFIESSVVYSDSIEQKDKYLYTKFKEEQFDSSIYFNLLKLHQNLNEKGIDIIFLEIPTNRLYNYFSSAFIRNYEKLITTLDEHTQILRLDSSKFQMSNYRNIDHMNSSGALIATKEIIHFLENK